MSNKEVKPLNPSRVTVALDKTTTSILEKLTKESGFSQSEIVRRALKIYDENKAIQDPKVAQQVKAYVDLLLQGEHVILDVDHWLLFLRFIESCPDKEKFWKEHREVARSHWEQLKTKIHTPEELLTRLETCNLFRLKKNAENDFTLVLVSEFSKDFVRLFLSEYFAAMGLKVEVTENLTKLRVLVKPMR
jgi:hypothetical protein